METPFPLTARTQVMEPIFQYFKSLENKVMDELLAEEETEGDPEDFDPDLIPDVVGEDTYGLAAHQETIDLEDGADQEGVAQRAWLCGPPEHFLEELKKLEEEYPGLEHVMFRWPEGTPIERFKEQLSIFAAEVMPHFGK